MAQKEEATQFLRLKAGPQTVTQMYIIKQRAQVKVMVKININAYLSPFF